MKNYYDLLEVSSKASTDTITRVFKLLVKKYHPDLFTGKQKEQAEKKLMEINEAYAILSDEKKRKAYDFDLEQEKIQQELKLEKLERLQQENDNLKQELSQISPTYSPTPTFSHKNVIQEDKNNYDTEPLISYLKRSLSEHFKNISIIFFILLLLFIFIGIISFL